MASKSFIGSISGLTDVLYAAFGSADDIYYVFSLTIKVAFDLECLFGFPWCNFGCFLHETAGVAWFI